MGCWGSGVNGFLLKVWLRYYIKGIVGWFLGNEFIIFNVLGELLGGI